MQKWKPRPDPRMDRMHRQRMTLRLSEDEWQEVAAVRGNRTLSDTMRALVAAGLNAIADRNRERAP